MIRVVRIVLVVPYLAALTVAVGSLTRWRHGSGAHVGGNSGGVRNGGRRPGMR